MSRSAVSRSEGAVIRAAPPIRPAFSHSAVAKLRQRTVWHTVFKAKRKAERRLRKSLAARSPVVTYQKRRAFEDEDEVGQVDDLTEAVDPKKLSSLDWEGKQVIEGKEKETRYLLFSETKIAQQLQSNKKWAYASGYHIAAPSPFSDPEIESAD